MKQPIEAWTGKFGDEYTKRNPITPERLKALKGMWSRILPHLELREDPIILDVGANIGANTRVLRDFFPAAWIDAVEPNDEARIQNTAANAIWERLEDVDEDATYTLVFTCGVLIHIPPEKLISFCKQMYERSGRYIVCIEYFSQQPTEVPYRGQMGLLWKRDFGKVFLDLFPDLRPIACGFEWKPMTGLDDLTWWIFEKQP